MKQVQVIWSMEALSDLETIYDFIAEGSQQAALKFTEKILSRTRQIESFPESGPKQFQEQSPDKEYRYLVEGNYKIIYRISDQHALIVALFDTRYNPDKLKI